MFDHPLNNLFESSMKALLFLQMLPAEWSLSRRNKRGKVTRKSWLANTGSLGVFFSTRPRRPYCVSKQIEWLALWQVSLRGFWFTESARLRPRSPHGATSREPQSCLLCCWMATVPLAFWLRVEEKKTRSTDKFGLSLWTKCSSFFFFLSFNVSVDSYTSEVKSY